MDAHEPRLAVGVVSMAAPDLLERCLAHASLLRGFEPAEGLAVVMNGPAVGQVCAKWEGVNGVAVHRPGRNLGTCASWNRLCRRAFSLWPDHRRFDGVLLLNDDMALTDPTTLEMFAAVYREGGLRQMRFVMGRGFSAVCVTRAVFEEVGPFDEGFWPAYYEDNDYWRRFTLRGIAWDHVVVDSVHEGSATLNRSEELKALNGHTFTLNGDRYRGKWGGGPHQEQYGTPWNGGEPWPGTRERVAPEIRDRLEAAYGPRDDSW